MTLLLELVSKLDIGSLFSLRVNPTLGYLHAESAETSKITSPLRTIPPEATGRRHESVEPAHLGENATNGLTTERRHGYESNLLPVFSNRKMSLKERGLGR
jgi:hypothetical protein